MKDRILGTIIVVLLGLAIAFGYTTYEAGVQLQSCQAFVADADNLVGLAGEALELSSQAIDAVEDTEMERIADEFDKINPKIEAGVKEYKASRSACTELPDQGDI